ncbi:MAG: lipopolysaccharide heptosyltransferase II [Syntrophobacterales bacterium]|nr:lipopolysaccharide heptosyltransferase II [Syntrophobacterales bacterium]
MEDETVPERVEVEMLKVRGKVPFPFGRVRNVLVRSTNWIGDVVMTFPAIAAVRKTMPEARITALAKPWVAELLRLCPDVDEVMLFQSPGTHDGLSGKLRLAAELRARRFDAAILLQNAIEAAIIARLARIPVRAGYDSDCRRLLLTHSVGRTREIRKVHQIDYYLEMIKALGFVSAGRDVRLNLGDDYREAGKDLLQRYGIGGGRILVGMAPGATYGPAKRWYPDRFAGVSDRLHEEFNGETLLFGSKADHAVAEEVKKHAVYPVVNVAGQTSLKEAIALIAQCRLFISNDSGLMHVAGALGVPLVAVFGSTNPVTTSPVGEKSIIVTKGVSCSPCLKEKCDTDFRCMDLITADEVYEAAKGLLAPGL